MIHVVCRHAVGNVGPTERSPILKYWQCGPAPQPPAWSSEGCSLQTVATASFVAGARGPAAFAAEAAAAKRSAALSAIVILFDISWVPCGCVLASCRSSSGSYEWLHRRPRFGCPPFPDQCAHALRLSRPSRIGISNSASRRALKGANQRPRVDGL